MTKRIFSTIILLCLFHVVTGCRGDKYADCVELNERFVQLMEQYVASLEKSVSATEVGAAMHRFADGMEVLGPKMKKMVEKYPELKDKNIQLEELKPSQEKGEEMLRKIAGLSTKIMPYMGAPEVHAAQKRIVKAMHAISRGLSSRDLSPRSLFL